MVVSLHQDLMDLGSYPRTVTKFYSQRYSANNLLHIEPRLGRIFPLDRNWDDDQVRHVSCDGGSIWPAQQSHCRWHQAFHWGTTTFWLSSRFLETGGPWSYRENSFQRSCQRGFTEVCLLKTVALLSNLLCGNLTLFINLFI